MIIELLGPRWNGRGHELREQNINCTDRSMNNSLSKQAVKSFSYKGGSEGSVEKKRKQTRGRKRVDRICVSLNKCAFIV